jgi:hypothetical protein
MDNTLENKEKFISQYWGQVLISDLTNGGVRTLYPIGHSNLYNLDEIYLELKPISQMTLKEGQKFLEAFFRFNTKSEVVNIIVIPEKCFIIEFKYPDNETPEDDEGFSYSSVTIDAERTSYEHIDWLRYHGFAVTWMGLDVPTLLSYGWIKLKELPSLRKHVTKKRKVDEKPEYCPEEDGDGDTCKECSFLSSERVGHPGGSSYHSVDKFTCTLGYWEDNF